MANFKLSRREAMTSLLAVSAAGALAACSNGSDPAEPRGDLDLKFASPTEFFTADEMAFLSAVADTIIPDTETAGAVGAGVPETIQGLASVWGDNDYRRYWRAGLRSLGEQLGTDRPFVDMDAAARTERLADYDAKVFDGVLEDSFYRDLKSTVVEAYYVSEIGASEELAYEPVPGDWIGCAPLSDYPKTWAT